jgi:hypothetical protein
MSTMSTVSPAALPMPGSDELLVLGMLEDMLQLSELMEAEHIRRFAPLKRKRLELHSPAAADERSDISGPLPLRSNWSKDGIHFWATKFDEQSCTACNERFDVDEDQVNPGESRTQQFHVAIATASTSRLLGMLAEALRHDSLDAVCGRDAPRF